MLFASDPFLHLGGDDMHIAQMIGFVEELPPDWEEEWQQMPKTSAAHDLSTRE